MVKITFKDGVSIELHEDMSFDVVEYSNYSSNFNYHAIMTVSEADFVTDEIKKPHEEYLFKNINRRLGGILSA